MITEGIVIRYTNYRENDRILTLLTPEHGRIDVLSRGCRKQKSPLLPGSELLTSGEFNLVKTGERMIVSSIALHDSFYPIRTEPYRFTCATYLAEIFGAAVQPGEESNKCYALLLSALYTLAYEPDSNELATTAAVMLLCIDALGFRPRFIRCIHCHTLLDLSGECRMDAEAGGLCCPNCSKPGTWPLSHDEVVWLSETLRLRTVAQLDARGCGTFPMLRDYLEQRLEIPIKSSRLLP